MSAIMKLYPSIEFLHERKPFSCPTLEFKMIFSVPNTILQSKKTRIVLIGGGRNIVRGKAAFLANYSEEGSVQAAFENSPVSIELEPILSEAQFDQVIAEAQQPEEPVLIVWCLPRDRQKTMMPVIELLVGDQMIQSFICLGQISAMDISEVRFFCVDVNNVSHKLVVRAGLTLWKDGQKQAEVIGGHKAHLVVSEAVKEMEYTL